MSIPPNKTLERLLDYTSLKQKVIGQNIANTETIGYQRKDVEFKELLNSSIANQMKGTSSKSEFQIKNDESKENVSGFNNVDINREMADLAENTILFKFGSKKLNAYYRSLQNVIKGGR